MKIYTGLGDNDARGRSLKNNICVEAYGTIDELIYLFVYLLSLVHTVLFYLLVAILLMNRLFLQELLLMIYLLVNII